MNVIEARRSVKHYDPDHVLSFTVAVGKQTKPAWPRGECLPDSEVVIEDRFGGGEDA